MSPLPKIRFVILPALLLIGGCVSDADVRAQVDKAKAEMQAEITATRGDIGKLSVEINAVRVEATARTDRLAADLAVVRGDLLRVSADLSKSVCDLEKIIQSSSGMLREHLIQQRAALASQVRAMDLILATNPPTGGDSSATSVVPSRRP